MHFSSLHGSHPPQIILHHGNWLQWSSQVTQTPVSNFCWGGGHTRNRPHNCTSSSRPSYLSKLDCCDTAIYQRMNHKGFVNNRVFAVAVGISIPVPSQCRWTGMLLRFVLGWWPLAQKSWESSESQRKECWVAKGTRSQRLGRKNFNR